MLKVSLLYSQRALLLMLVWFHVTPSTSFALGRDVVKVPYAMTCCGQLIMRQLQVHVQYP